MNYTKPHDMTHNDKPEDWLNSALLFASALGHILKEREGVVVDIQGDVQMDSLLERGCSKVFVYASEKQIHISECWDDIPAGTLVWMHDTEWHRQFLEDEKLWYITEHHHEDGILGEHFFELGEEDKMEEFIKEYNITFNEPSENITYDIDAEAELAVILMENIKEEMGEEAYQTQQLDLAKQMMDQTYPSWRELQSDSVKEEIDMEILRQIKENGWKVGEELTTLERWDLVKKYHAGKHTIPWDRMALPTHKWFDEYTTFYNTNIPITIPKYRSELSNDEIGYLKMVANYREEDKKFREERKKNK